MMWIIFTNGFMGLLLFWQNFINYNKTKEIQHEIQMLRVVIESLEKVKTANHDALVMLLEKAGIHQNGNGIPPTNQPNPPVEPPPHIS